MSSTNVDALSGSASDALDQLQHAAAPAIKRGKRQAGVLLEQSRELIDATSQGTGEAITNLGNSLIAYTKKNPLIALLFAAGAGALLVTAAKSAQSRWR